VEGLGEGVEPPSDGLGVEGWGEVKEGEGILELRVKVFGGVELRLRRAKVEDERNKSKESSR